VLAISLYSCPYLKLAKALCLSYYLLCFLFNKIGEEGRTGSAWKCGQGGGGGGRRGAGGGRGGEVAQTLYICMNKCINNTKIF
jgi:hypothetical protein